MKGQVVTLLFDTEDAIYDSARETVWRGLTENEQERVIYVEGEEGLFELFCRIQDEFRKTGTFEMPEDFYEPDRVAFQTMHRFAVELQGIIDQHWSMKGKIDGFNADGTPYIPGPSLRGLRKPRTLRIRKKKIGKTEEST